MPLDALGLALGAAALHAFWNLLLARERDTEAATAVAVLSLVAILALPAALTWRVEGAAVPYLAASAALELAYIALLAAAYGRAGVTFVYPVARGSGPVLVLAVSVTVLGVAFSFGQVAGVLAVTAGVLLVRGVGHGDRAALVLALGVGACIAGYTLIDKRGLRYADPIPYFEIVIALTAIPYAAFVAARGGDLRAACDGRAVVTGIGMFVAYALTLAALVRAEAAPVAALRETSVVMAALAAVALGRERTAARALLGAAAVVAGVAAIALS